MPLAVLRELRKRGHSVSVAFHADSSVGLAPDNCVDFEASGDLFRLVEHREPDSIDELQKIISSGDIELVLQVGSPWAYSQLSLLKETNPDLKIVDWLFNNGPHFHAHSFRSGMFDGVLVESQDMRNQISTFDRLGRVEVVSSGVDLDSLHPTGRATLPFTSPLRVGYLGRMSAEKNPLGFVAIAAQLIGTMPDATLEFYMFGEGAQSRDVEMLISKLGLESKVHFSGYQKRLIDALSQIDIMLVPSLLDGRPAAVMEACAAGVPVIAHPVGGIPEMIETGVNGFLFENLAGLKEVISGILSGAPALEDLRESTRNYALSNFSRSQMLDAYESVLQDFVDSPARRLPAIINRLDLPS